MLSRSYNEWRQRRNERTRIVVGVNRLRQFRNRFHFKLANDCFGQRVRMPERFAFQLAQRMRQRTSADAVSASLVAQQISPTAAAFRAAIGSPTKRDRTRAGNQGNSTAIRRAGRENRQHVRYDRNLIRLIRIMRPTNKLLADLRVRRAGDRQHEARHSLAILLRRAARLFDRAADRPRRFGESHAERIPGRAAPAAQHAIIFRRS